MRPNSSSGTAAGHALDYASPRTQPMLDNTGRAQFTRVTCLILATTTAATFVGVVWNTLLVNDLLEARRTAGLQRSPALENLNRYIGITEWANAVVGLVFVVAFLMWLYRAVLIIRATTGGSRESPGWSVGWWFIPVANLFMPYFVLRDLWTRSGADRRTGSDHTPMVFWILWVTPTLLSVTTAIIAFNRVGWTIDSAYLQNLLTGAGLVLEILALLVLHRLIAGVSLKPPSTA